MINIVLFLIGAVVAAMMTTGADSHFESDGQSVTVSLLHMVAAKQVAFVDGWLGVTAAAGESGDQIALDIAQCERQFTVPAGLSVSKGDIVYITVADVTGHTPNDTAYSTSAGAGKIAFFKATSNKDTTNNVVTGIVLPNLAS
ncbi:MAG: hypothetical protein D6698_16355 [Gammaproteobacteria bacterium]|nr:MAG: hypothetical protein D6698_16355 [Gammaproteobacteria bacterium]